MDIILWMVVGAAVGAGGLRWALKAPDGSRRKAAAVWILRGGGGPPEPL